MSRKLTLEQTTIGTVAHLNGLAILELDKVARVWRVNTNGLAPHEIVRPLNRAFRTIVRDSGFRIRTVNGQICLDPFGYRQVPIRLPVNGWSKWYQWSES